MLKLLRMRLGRRLRLRLRLHLMAYGGQPARSRTGRRRYFMGAEKLELSPRVARLLLMARLARLEGCRLVLIDRRLLLAEVLLKGLVVLLVSLVLVERH